MKIISINEIPTLRKYEKSHKSHFRYEIPIKNIILMEDNIIRINDENLAVYGKKKFSYYLAVGVRSNSFSARESVIDALNAEGAELDVPKRRTGRIIKRIPVTEGRISSEIPRVGNFSCIIGRLSSS